MNPIGELQAIRERAEKATPGPWSRVKSILCTWWTIGKIVNHIAKPSENEADWDFIEHARADVPALLDEIDRLEKENEELKVISGAKMLEILRLQKAVPLLVQAQPPQSISPEELINWLRKRDDIIEGSRL